MNLYGMKIKKNSTSSAWTLAFFLLMADASNVCAELSIDNPDFISPLAAASQQDSMVKLTEADQASAREQVLEVENLLEVTVRQDAKINKTVRVDEGGNIELHLLGKLKVTGLTVNELEKDIAQKLAQDYINNPVVMVKLHEYKAFSFTISGAVGRGGKYKLFTGMTLLDAVSMAGNLNAKSDPSNIRLIRANKKSGGGTEIKIDMDLILSGKSEDLPLEPGDQIVVGELEPIYLDGAVMSPGPFYVRNKISLRDALASVGGVTDMADINRIKVFEQPANKSSEAKIYDLKLVMEGKAVEPLIFPGSLILVEECATKYKFLGKIVCTHK